MGDKDSEATLATAETFLQEGKLEEASKLFGEVYELHDRENDTNGAIALSGLIQCVLKQVKTSLLRLIRWLNIDITVCREAHLLQKTW